MKKSRVFVGHSFALIVTVLLAGSVSFTACKKEDTNDHNSNKTYMISGDVSGTQEVLAVATTATATPAGEYVQATGELQYLINWTGLSGDATAIHFHGPAEAGINAAPVVTLSSSTNGTINVDHSAETDLLGGHWYDTIYTAANPDGEARGQVSVTAH